MDINRDEDNRSTNKAVIMAAFLLVLGVIYLFAGIFFGFYIPCPFRTVTGLKCPGCGLSHAATHLAMAVGALFRGDTTGACMLLKCAFYDNALFPIFFSYIIAAAYFGFRRKVLNDQNHDVMDSTPFRIINIGMLILVFAWWIVRNVTNH